MTVFFLNAVIHIGFGFELFRALLICAFFLYYFLSEGCEFND